MAPAPPTVCVTAPPELRRTVEVLAAPVLTACVSVIGPAVLTRPTSPLVVTTPVAPAAQTSAATVPTLFPYTTLFRSKAPAAVSETATLLVTVLATWHRSTFPAATTA